MWPWYQPEHCKVRIAKLYVKEADSAEMQRPPLAYMTRLAAAAGVQSGAIASQTSSNLYLYV